MHTIPHLFDDPVVTQLTSHFREIDTSAWLIGEYVRDRLLGRPTSTIEVAIDAPDAAEVYAHRLAGALGGTVVGSGAKRALGRVICTHPEDHTETYIQIYSVHGSDIAATLRRHTFTINAMAVEPESRRLIDPHGGYVDLNRRRLRVIDEASFADDPLRLLDVVQLATTLACTIDHQTRDMMRRDADRLSSVPPTDVGAVFLTLLAQEPAAPVVAFLDETNLLEQILPELTSCQEVDQPDEHTLDVYGHTLAVLTALERLFPWSAADTEAPSRSFWSPPLARYREPLSTYLQQELSSGQLRWALLKLAVLLHDVGKPATRTVDTDGEIHFYDHEHVGAELAERRLRALRFPETSIAWIATIIQHHLAPLRLGVGGNGNIRSPIQFGREVGDPAAAIALHSAADQLGKGDSRVKPAVRGAASRIWAASLIQTGGSRAKPLHLHQ